MTGKYREQRPAFGTDRPHTPHVGSPRPQTPHGELAAALEIEAVLVMTPGGRIINASQGFLLLLGTTQGQLLGTHPKDWIHPEDAPSSLAELREATVTFRTWHDRWRDTQGEWHWLAWRAQTRSGKIIGVARDVTDQIGGDVTNTLDLVAERIHEIDKRGRRTELRIAEDSGPKYSSEKIDEYEESLLRGQKWWKRTAWLASAIGVIFTAGITYAVWMQGNATRADVKSSVDGAIVEHNGGVDPEAKNPVTGVPHGTHPELTKAVSENAKAIKGLTTTAQKDKDEDKKRDLRLRYLYELGRWEAESLERERKGLRPQGKPSELKTLESLLINN